MKNDSDIAGFLLPGLVQKPTLLSTLGWWHTTWVGGPKVPFWRPLTSLGFWLEYHAFSPDRVERWMVVTAVSHLLFVALLLILAQRMTGRWWLGVLAVLLFAGSREPLVQCLSWGWLRSFTSLGVTPATVALDNWKNQPEMWAGVCTLAALILACDRRWGWGMACAAAAVCFKESGWLTFPLAGVVLWARGELHAVPCRVWVYGAVLMVALVVLRAWAGPAVFWGYHFGENVNWWTRYFKQIGGCYLLSLTDAYSAGGAAFGTVLFILMRWWRRPLASGAAVGAAALLIIAAVQMPLCEGDFTESVAYLLGWGEGLFWAVQAFLWLSLAYPLWEAKSDRRLTMALILMCLLSCAVVALASQIQVHVLYLASAFQSLLVSLMLAATAGRLTSGKFFGIRPNA